MPQEADVEKAKAEDIHLNLRNVSPNNVAAGFFTEEVRRELADRYGSTQLYEGGFRCAPRSIRRCSSSRARRSSTGSCAMTNRMAGTG